jgi:ABC-type microcin C transport system permease subunit YejE
MIATTNCQHCGKEFETDGMNRTEFCPHCGKETSIVAQVAVPAPASSTGTAATLKQIRQQTCYKTLRGLIDLVQILFFVAAGFAVLGAIAGCFEGSEVLPASKFANVIIGLASAFILIVLAIAWKQAALLLVDIADCQIRQAGNKS